MKKLVCAITLILISSCAVQKDDSLQTEEQIDYKQLESLRPKKDMSEREKAERLKQIIANRERIFAEANKGLFHVQFQGLNYYSKFPEQKRREIYKYGVKIEDETGGMMDWDELNRRVTSKYGITFTEARNISLEGGMKRWPMPEPPELP